MAERASKNINQHLNEMYDSLLNLLVRPKPAFAILGLFLFAWAVFSFYLTGLLPQQPYSTFWPLSGHLPTIPVCKNEPLTKPASLKACTPHLVDATTLILEGCNDGDKHMIPTTLVSLACVAVMPPPHKLGERAAEIIARYAGSQVSCDTEAGRGYKCSPNGGSDLRLLLLEAGLAATLKGAGEELIQAECAAVRARRGIWWDPPPDAESICPINGNGVIKPTQSRYDAILWRYSREQTVQYADYTQVQRSQALGSFLTAAFAFFGGVLSGFLLTEVKGSRERDERATKVRADVIESEKNVRDRLNDFNSWCRYTEFKDKADFIRKLDSVRQCHDDHKSLVDSYHKSLIESYKDTTAATNLRLRVQFVPSMLTSLENDAKDLTARAMLYVNSEQQTEGFKALCSSAHTTIEKYRTQLAALGEEGRA